MPACFGEVLLRVYTRDSRYVTVRSNYDNIGALANTLVPSFFGLIQAGYRECLKNFKFDSFAQAVPNLGDNHFTTVPPNYRPPSPAKGVKRTLDIPVDLDGPLKRRAISYGAAEFKMSTSRTR